jgi:hypothetical protein
VPQLATDLILIGRSAATGRFQHRPALEMALRAALFTELIFDDRLVSRAMVPVATDQEPLDDRVLNTLRNAVRDHSNVTWRRWYRHVAADREVLTKQLIESGRWVAEPGRFGRTVLRDTQQDATVVAGQRVARVARHAVEPDDRDEAVLAILATLCGALGGRPRPRELRRGLTPLLDVVGPVTDPVRRSLEPALRGCALAIRRRTRILF